MPLTSHQAACCHVPILQGAWRRSAIPLPARRRAGGHDSHRPASFPATQGASMNRTTHTRSHTLTLTSAMAKSG